MFNSYVELTVVKRFVYSYDTVSFQVHLIFVIEIV